MNILALCHGRSLNNPQGTKCMTSLVDIKFATYLDKNASIKPHVLQDFKKPFSPDKRYDIITTVCCDGNIFFNEKRKTIETQPFKNIACALKPNGLFIFPKYDWVDKKCLLEIEKYITLVKKVESKHHAFYLFKSKI
jgi:hypothetical protein